MIMIIIIEPIYITIKLINYSLKLAGCLSDLSLPDCLFLLLS